MSVLCFIASEGAVDVTIQEVDLRTTVVGLSLGIPDMHSSGGSITTLTEPTASNNIYS